jgi:hypothetical protein
MDEQLTRERADEQQRRQATTDGSSQDQARGQAGAQPDPHGVNNGQDAEGKSPANAAEAGPPDQTGAGTGARAGEYR